MYAEVFFLKEDPPLKLLLKLLSILVEIVVGAAKSVVMDWLFVSIFIMVFISLEFSIVLFGRGPNESYENLVDYLVLLILL